MSSERKVELAGRARCAFSLPSALAALELPRSTWHYHQSRRRSYTEKYADLRAPLEAIARRHPEYGYRRTTPELRERTGRRIYRNTPSRFVTRVVQVGVQPNLHLTYKHSGVKQYFKLNR
ncbi:MAG: hypothetical protein M1389_05475, partial [Chloroflexi bacterium]|nr:hypothetical protein [Chloroflexota bacterium]